MSEYGKEKSLTEILQELVFYCKNNSGGGEVQLKVKLPESVLYEYELSFRPFGLAKTPLIDGVHIKKVHFSGGTVELES